MIGNRDLVGDRWAVMVEKGAGGSGLAWITILMTFASFFAFSAFLFLSGPYSTLMQQLLGVGKDMLVLSV